MVEFKYKTSIRLSEENCIKITDLMHECPDKFPNQSRVLRVGLQMLHRKHFPNGTGGKNEDKDKEGKE